MPALVPTITRPGTCAHPEVSDRAIVEGLDAAFRYWDSNLATFGCASCGETLYPDGNDDEIVVWVGEPRGAGGD